MSWPCPKCSYPNPDRLESCFKCNAYRITPPSARPQLTEVSLAELQAMRDEFDAICDSFFCLSAEERAFFQSADAESLWDERAALILHVDPEQVKRQLSAENIPVDPLMVDSESNDALIGKYVVSLENCGCMDHAIRRLPCKHMYALASHLGISFASPQG